MTQLRFIGLADDLTQETHLLMLQAVTKAGIRQGLQASIENGPTSGSLVLHLTPGIFVMPDGFVVQETSDIYIPLTPPSSSSTYTATIVASRSSDPGLMNDTVDYTILPPTGGNGLYVASTLPVTANIVQLPLAWVTKTNGSTASAFTVVNLGYRSQEKMENYLTPLPNLCDLNNTSTIGFDTVTNSLYHNIYPSSNCYLQLGYDIENILSTVVLVGVSAVAANQLVTVQSMMAIGTYKSIISQTYPTGGTTFQVFILNYPNAAMMQQDVLKLTVVNQNGAYATTPFLLKQVVVNHLGILS